MTRPRLELAPAAERRPTQTQDLAQRGLLVLALLLLVLAALPVRAAAVLRPVGPRLLAWRVPLAGTGLAIGCGFLVTVLLNTSP